MSIKADIIMIISLILYFCTLYVKDIVNYLNLPIKKSKKKTIQRTKVAKSLALLLILTGLIVGGTSNSYMNTEGVSDGDDTEKVTEQPKTEQPKTEQPKTEQPKTEQPKTEQNKISTFSAEEEKGTEKCSDGKDNDGDGDTDGKDSDCVVEEEKGTEKCSDGKDNDGDEKIDADDPDCLPEPNPGKDQTVNAGDIVTLDGSGSCCDIVEWKWEQTGGPNVNLMGAGEPISKFTAPNVLVDTVLTFQLTVRNEIGEEASDTMQAKIIGTGIGSAPPITRPGPVIISPPSQTTIIRETTQPVQPNCTSLMYENTTKGIRIQRPCDWTIKESDSNVTFYSPLQDNSDRFQEAFRMIRFSGNMPLDNLVNQVLNDARRILPEFQLINSTITTLDDMPAHMIVYKYRDHNLGLLQQMSILTIKDDKAYIIGYIGESTKFSSYIPTIQNMVNSFEMGPFTNAPLLFAPN
jgi:hypothetical protein